MKCVQCGEEFKPLKNLEEWEYGAFLCKECEEQAITEICSMEADYDDIDNWYNQYY